MVAHHGREQIGAGLRFVATDPYLRVLTAYGALSNLALAGYQAVLVVFLVREVGVDPAAVGLGAFGRPEGYLERQVRRWVKQWDATRIEGHEALDALAALVADRFGEDE